MSNLLKMERYQLSHNFLYWCGMVGIFLIGFFTAETYVPEVMGTTGGAATSLADIFNGMVYDSTFLLILMSSILALILGQEFSYRTVDLEITAGHSRKSIFFSKVITYLIAFNVMALVYPIARKKRIGTLYSDAKNRLDVSPILSNSSTLLKKRLNATIPQKYRL